MLVRRPWFVFLFGSLVALSVVFAVSADAQISPISVAQPRINLNFDETSMVPLRGNVHPLAQTKFDSGPAPVSMPASRLHLVLMRSTQQEADLHISSVCSRRKLAELSQVPEHR
jgi:hypothetical protein